MSRRRRVDVATQRLLTRRPCSQRFWRRQPEGLGRELGKSQSSQNRALNCCFLALTRRKTGHYHLRQCCECRTRAPRIRHAEPEGRPKRAKQRANGVRLRATPTDGRRQSPQVDGSSGDTGRRRNTQKIWFASRRPGVRVPLAPQVRAISAATSSTSAWSTAASPRAPRPRSGT